MEKGRILIIDDDPDITEAMTVVLTNKGYEVHGAGDGSEGMEQLKKSRPDLIILDVMMRTRQEGFELSRELLGIKPQLVEWLRAIELLFASLTANSAASSKVEAKWRLSVCRDGGQ